MAEAPAGGAGAGGANNAQALIAKHAAVTQAGGDDAATIQRVEDAIKNSPMGWLQSMMGEVDSRAASEKGQVQGKIAEQQTLVSQNQDKAPKEAGPAPAAGPATHPAVPSPTAAPHTGPTTPAPATGGTPAQHAPIPGAAPQRSAAPAATPAAAPAPTIASAIAGAGSDSQLDGILNAYAPKAQQTSQTLGRIKQMGDIAQGFNGQLDVYVAQGGAVEKGIAATANFLGTGKDVAAVWANNPYRKVHGILGGIMTGLSAVKNVCSVVGNICGKLGIVLTVIGLLGMIFPPVGVAVSGIARILNVVGVICDAVSFALSGILTGLNGVVLAQQIASGASAEEKAATADLMMSEANDAASGFINMAMIFGPKFMKGMLSSSKGVVGALLRRAKAVIGRVSIKASGDLKLFASKVVRKLGFGGAALDRVGGAWKDTGIVARTKTAIGESRVAQAWNSAPEHLEAMQNKLMSRYGNTAFARGLDRVGAWSGTVASKFDLEDKVGDLGERAGKSVGNAGADTAFAKRMSAAADQSELDTRRLAMQMDARDAAHLEQTRWQNTLDKRAAANPDGIRNEAVEQKFIGQQGARVQADAAADFESKEAKTATSAKIDDMKKARFERHRDEYFENETNAFTGKDARTMQMDTLHDSRAKRFQLETQFKAQDAERADLLAKAGRSAEDDAKLASLNTTLRPLDDARHLNEVHEGDLAKLASGGEATRHPDYKTWGDVGANVWSAVDPALQLSGLKDSPAAWQSAEKSSLKKQVKFDKGKASGNAASRGGHGTYADIASTAQQAQMADFSAFVRSSARPRSLGSSVRNILSPVTNRPGAAAPQPVAAAPAPATAPKSPSPGPTPVAPPAASEAMVVTPQVVDGGAVANTNAPATNAAAAPAAPAPTVASVAMAAMEDAAAEPLPYWPAMMPEFDRASSDFGWMRKVAVEFKKAQIEGKQKAVDTLAVYGRYQEYAKLRAAAAAAHANATQTTAQSAQQNVSAAGQSEQHGAQGEAKQGEARGAANDRAAVDLPEPESRGFWGRILGAVKRWAKDKAAQVFGWIQEKIASVVLKGLCGVSMGDMREYAGALKRQQAAAHGVATGAGSTAGQAQQTAIKLGTDATKEAQSAADAIGECDQNITDVDNFTSDVTQFEQQLAEEKAFAQTFLAQLHAEVQAQQAKQKSDAAAEAAADARANTAGTAAAAAGGGVAGVAMAAMTATAAEPQPHEEAKAQPAEPAPQPADNGDNAAIHSAASYVGGQSDSLSSALETRADDYHNQLKIALTNHTGKDAGGVDLQGPAKKGSKTIVEEFKTVASHTKTDMDGFASMSIDPSSAHKIADTIIQSADHLEDAFAHSEQALDNLFERTYAGIRDGKRTLKSQLLDGNNVVGQANHAGDDVTNKTIDTSLPTMTTAWNNVSQPIQVAPSAPPVQRKADSDATAGDPAAVAQRGLGAGSALPHGDRIQAAFGHHDVGGIRAHTGAGVDQSAKAIGATAYATGDNVAFAGGTPDLHTAAHEAAHVIQQRQGVQLKGGIDGGKGDPYEQHADRIADAVVAGGSAAPLLDEMVGGGAAHEAPVQRREKDDKTGDTKPADQKPADITLPDGVNMQVTSDGTITVRTSWYMDTDYQPDGNIALAPSKVTEILGQLKSGGVLPWIDAADIPRDAAILGLRGFDASKPFNTAHGIAFDVYALIGPPPAVDVAIQRDGAGGLATIVRQPLVIPGPVDEGKEITLNQPVRQKIVATVERFTKMPMPADRKALLVAPTFGWKAHVNAGDKGVRVPVPAAALELAYGKAEWAAYLKKPEDHDDNKKGGLPGAVQDTGPQFNEDVPEAERQYFLAWMKRVEGSGGVPGASTTELSEAMVKKLHDIDADPKHAEIESKLRNTKNDGSGGPLTLAMLDNAKARADLGLDTPSSSYKPLFPEPVVGRIINRGALNYLGQETEFYFRCDNHHDAFAVPELGVQWVVTKRGSNTPIDRGNTKSIDISTETPDYFSTTWPEVGVYTIHAFVSHSFYQSGHFTTDVEVKTEAQRTQELNDKAYKGLQGTTTSADASHKFDTSWTNDEFGSNKETRGKLTVGELPPDFQRMSFEDRVKFLASDRKNLEGMIEAHKDSTDPQWKATLEYAQDQLATITALQTTLGKENTDGATFFDARGTFLSRKNGVPDKALTLIASAKKADGKMSITLHDTSQVYEPKNYTFTKDGSTWAEAIEKTFVDLCKSYPPGRISCLFEALDDDAKPTKTTRGFELDTGTAWKDAKAILYNSKVQTAINIAGAATMIFFPLAAPFLFPALAAYNSIGTIDNMVDLSTKGVLDHQSIALGIAEIGLNVLPYVGELKPVASLGKIALYSLDGLVVAGQSLVITADALQQLREIRDQDVQGIADLDAEIRAREAANQSDPDLPGLKAEEQRRIKAAQDESKPIIEGLLKGNAIMLMQMGALHGLQKAATTHTIGELKGKGMFEHVKDEPLQYDPNTATIRGDETTADTGQLAKLQQAYETDMMEKQAQLKGLLSTDNVEIARGGTKTVIEKTEAGYKVTIPTNEPFAKAALEVQRYAAKIKPANGAKVAPPPLEPMSHTQQQLITSRVAATPGAHIGDTVDNSFLTEQQSDIERWQTHGLEDTANDTGTNPKAQAQSAQVKQWLNDPDFRHWYDVWMSMPDRVTVDAQGNSKVNLPHGVPPEIGEHLQAIGAAGNVGLMTRALDVSRRIEERFPGLDPDPSSAAWKQARPQLVEMLGEDEVAKYEAEHGGTQSAPEREKMEGRIDDLLAPGELERIQDMLPGMEIYVTGSLAQTGKGLGDVSDLDLIIVTPKGTPQNVRAEIEQRVQSIAVKRKAPGAQPLPVDAKVMTPEEFMGLSMNKTPAGRTPLSNFRVDTPTDAPAAGTAASGGDLHNHVMGVPDTQYFIDKVGNGNAVVTLEKLHQDVNNKALWKDGKPEVTGNVLGLINKGYSDVEQAKTAGMNPSAVDARARRALDQVLSANNKVPFDSTYDVRDLLVQQHIDPGGKQQPFTNFAKDVIEDLHDQGVTYSEQSVSEKKLGTRFSEQTMDKAHKQAQADGKDSEMNFLVMAPTDQTLASSTPVSSKADAALEKYLMRKDVKGLDVAGPEKQAFTAEGMNWLIDRYKLLDRVAKKKGERMVLRPHVGEGYDPDHSGEHIEMARENLRMLVTKLSEAGYNGQGNVIVRLGHATHATPEILRMMADSGIIVEANVGSNIATGSVLRAEDHPLLQNMYYNVKTILSTDGQGVMSTTLRAEYARAQQLVSQFKSGIPLEVDGKQVNYADLTDDQKIRFSVDWLKQQLADYQARSSEKLPAETPTPAAQ